MTTVTAVTTVLLLKSDAFDDGKLLPRLIVNGSMYCVSMRTRVWAVARACNDGIFVRRVRVHAKPTSRTSVRAFFFCMSAWPGVHVGWSHGLVTWVGHMDWSHGQVACTGHVMIHVESAPITMTCSVQELLVLFLRSSTDLSK